MSYNNVFVKYPQLVDCFNERTGIFKGFSISYINSPINIGIRIVSNIDMDCYKISRLCSSNPKLEITSNYLEHVKRVLEQHNLQDNKEVIDFAMCTADAAVKRYINNTIK